MVMKRENQKEFQGVSYLLIFIFDNLILIIVQLYKDALDNCSNSGTDRILSFKDTPYHIQISDKVNQ